MIPALLLALIPSALGISVYGQCGGQNWSGSGSCDSGLSCSSVNPYYFQCVSGAASATVAPTTVPTKPVTTSARPTTTTSGAGTTLITSRTATGTSPTTSAAAASNAAGNIFAGRQIYANPYYASEVAAAIPALPSSLRAKASAVAKIGTFVWLDTAAKVPTVETYLADIEKQNAAGAKPEIIGAFVVYDLPNRDCAALSSNGELTVANDGLTKYKAYIDSIAAIIKKHSTTKVALIIEPDSLGNLVTNSNVAKCQEAHDAYISGVEYAIKTLNFDNVAMYLDGGHGGWLGWPANIGPAADLFASIYTAAGKPKSLRGIATDVSNYNAYQLATAPSYTQSNPNFDEQRYVNALAPLLTAQGFPAHFIIDQGRSGVQPTSQLQQGDWCNVINTGFGTRPTTNTGDALVDAIVWVKPGGESDGTSDSSSARYDAHCGYADALKPAPEAGTWFQAYFEQLLKNANPTL
ncbi:glycoside hydrolase [Aureobasidium sp. EXF-8845]|nr:glycoside hydrolase [Aureobasidium sp. EXF-8845]KAI4845387.1 glycoside hydrolase [Aureobasidium sp. EXF-8846]